MTRSIAFVTLAVLQLVFVLIFPLAPTLCTGAGYVLERGMDRLRLEWVGRHLDLREYYPAVSS